MIGGWFDQHPWMTFNAPIINEAPISPAVRHFPQGVCEVSTRSTSPRRGPATRSTCCSVSIRADSLQEQPARPPHRSRLRCRVEQDVRQRACLLLNARTHRRGLSGSRRPQDVLRGDRLGAGNDRGKHCLASEAGGKHDSYEPETINGLRLASSGPAYAANAGSRRFSTFCRHHMRLQAIRSN